LEDIYLPYKPKRRTKAQIAREAGLEPLAEGLLTDPTQDPQEAATAYIDPDKGVADTKAALDGARAILVERFAEDADLTGLLREDIYLPYKPNRRTKAQIAREAGLEPLAEGLLTDPTQDPQEAATAYIDPDKGVADTKAALDGARAILVERFAEDADLTGLLR